MKWTNKQWQWTWSKLLKHNRRSPRIRPRNRHSRLLTSMKLWKKRKWWDVQLKSPRSKNLKVPNSLKRRKKWLLKLLRWVGAKKRPASSVSTSLRKNRFKSLRNFLKTAKKITPRSRLLLHRLRLKHLSRKRKNKSKSSNKCSNKTKPCHPSLAVEVVCQL